MREKEIKPTMTETPETECYLNTINKLLEINKNSQFAIQQNQWVIKALKDARKKALLEANKKN